MVSKVLSFYRNNFSGKFLYKMMVLYTVILTIVFFVFFQYVSIETRNVMRDKQILLNRQALNALYEGIDGKVKSFKDVIGYIYQNQEIFQPFMNLLISKDDSWLMDNPLNRKDFINKLKVMSYLDIDIRDITRYKKLTGDVYQYQFDNSLIIKSESASQARKLFPSNLKSGFMILPVHKSEYLFQRDSLNVFGVKGDIYIIGASGGKILGSVIVNYDVTVFNTMLKQFEPQIKGSFLISNNDIGGIIFDSLGRYFEKEYPPQYSVGKGVDISRFEEENYVDSFTVDFGNLTYSLSIPKSNFNKNVNIFQNTIYIVAFIMVLLVFIMYTWMTGIFSKRVKMVTKGMMVIGNNNLSYRIPIHGKNDEICQIADQFNRMCDNLQENIKKAYIYELKQKNSELNRLQSQVNPHFLYNTLEAIRFRAEKVGCEEIGEMIYALASLFRFSIKGDMIVDIAQELEYCRMYMKIFSVRYEDYFHTQFDIDERIQDYGIIKNLLPPLIENYVVHGFDSTKKDNWICIKGSMAGQDICFEISDNGKGIDAVKLQEIKEGLSHPDMNDDGSIGLVNVYERIKIVFGNEYGLDLDSILGQETRINIRIPAKTKEEIRNKMEEEKSYKF